MRRLITFLIILFVLLVSSSFIYVNLFEKTLTLEIPSPNGKEYNLTLNNFEIIQMSANSVLNTIDVEKGLNNSEEVEKYVDEINNEIIKYKSYYDFYYLEFQSFYPERYFILCVSDSCDYFFFSTSGLLHVDREDVNITNPLIVWVDGKWLEGFLSCLDEKGCDVLTYFKDGLIEGKFKVKNAGKVVERILERYRFNPQQG